MTKQIRVESWERELDRRASLRLPSPRLDYRPVEERITDFAEACTGFTPETARQEAARCVQCPEPQACQLACPLHNDIPAAIWEISRGNFGAAAQIYRKTSNFPELCGRLCPDETLCAGSCGVGKCHHSVRLGRLEAFAADYQRQQEGLPVLRRRRTSRNRVAVIGSGPAGLTAAEDLALAGHGVTIYEQRAVPGGTLVYTIPRFRLPLEVVESKVVQLERLGVEFLPGIALGANLTIDDLLRGGYQAVVLCSGAGKETVPAITGMQLRGVAFAQDFLRRTNAYAAGLPNDLSGKPILGKRVVINGCGHSAVDCARSAVRLGAQQVLVIYSGTEMEMLCRQEDKLAALEEGVLFQPLTITCGLLGSAAGALSQVVCQQMRPVCQAGRRGSEPVEGAQYHLVCDTFIFAQEPGPEANIALAVPGVELDEHGWIKSDPLSGETSRKGVFAAGDNTRSQHLAVYAIAEARRVAAMVNQYLG